MAIGSDPEIGTSFGMLKDFPTWEHLIGWHQAWRTHVGDDLCGGYATLCYVPKEKRCTTIDAPHAENESDN